MATCKRCGGKKLMLNTLLGLAVGCPDCKGTGETDDEWTAYTPPNADGWRALRPDPAPVSAPTKEDDDGDA